MAETLSMLPYDQASSFADPTADSAPKNKKRKRQRPIISCIACHKRKQKCDRRQPCSNCVTRSLGDQCRYETRPASSSPPQTTPSSAPADVTSPSPTVVSENYGYIRSHSNTNTAVEILEKLNLETGSTLLRDGGDSQDVPREKYGYIISRIPPRPYVQLLVNVFFVECNWMYEVLHEATFRAQVEDWYAAHGNGTREALEFTMLLLQVLAIACQMLPRKHWREMAQLTLGREDFRELSREYSNAGAELGTKLIGNPASQVMLQGWFLRASFLKSDGRTVESWHSLAHAIREAQEMGYHKERGVSRGGDVVENMWKREVEKRLWVRLYVWDRCMASIFGRPIIINDRYLQLEPPIDCEIPSPFPNTPPQPRNPLDPPTNYTSRLLEYQLAVFINEIEEYKHKTSSSDPSSDLATIDSLQRKLESIASCFPAYLSVTSTRDTIYDTTRPYLPAHAALLKATYYNLIIALHRPFLFTRNISRNEITRAGMEVMDSQDVFISALQPHHHNIHTINFFTFDPAILISAILITSSHTLDPTLLQPALNSLRQGALRLEHLGQTVALAEKGAAVMRVLLKKAEAAVEQTQSSPSWSTPNSSEPGESPGMGGQGMHMGNGGSVGSSEGFSSETEILSYDVGDMGMIEGFLTPMQERVHAVDWESEAYWQALLEMPGAREIGV